MTMALESSMSVLVGNQPWGDTPIQSRLTTVLFSTAIDPLMPFALYLGLPAAE